MALKLSKDEWEKAYGFSERMTALEVARDRFEEALYRILENGSITGERARQIAAEALGEDLQK